MRGDYRKHLIKTASIASLTAMLFATSASAGTGATGTEYSSKGTITDESSINIDSSDIYTLDNAIAANNRTLENYAATAGDIYNNLSAIDTAVAKAKTDIAKSLEDMNIYVSRNDAGAINSHAATTDWVGTTTSAKTATVANYTLEELIMQMKTSVTGAGSEMTAKINAGDFKSKKPTSAMTTGSQNINLAGLSEINLDKNQQLVLPSGYYGNGITINNVCSGGVLNWNPAGPETFTINGFYSSGTLSTSNAYQSGYAKGVADSKSTSAKITYTINHVHGDYCYPIPTAQYSSSHKDGGPYKRSVTCSVCGAYFSHTSGGGWPSDEQVYGPYYEHLVNGRCTAKGYQCGKVHGNRTTTDVKTLGSGDSLVSANIQF